MANNTEIIHPYKNTPYDILSDPDDPEVGVLSPDAPQAEIKRQQGKVLKSRKKDTREVARAARDLGYPHRLAVDVFICTNLDQSAAVDELSAQAQYPPVPGAAIQVDWTEGLDFWIEPPDGKVPLVEVKIQPQTVYDDPRGDLLAVEFDS